MKRLFSNLKAIVAVVAMTTMMGAAVSCSSEYDDTNITNRLDNIEKDLAALKERVAALEESLNAQVKALADLKAENAFVTDVAVVDGNTVVTLSDGTSFTVYAECTDEFVDTDKYLSVKEDNGVYYWAFFTADGFVAYLEVNGEKVPVYQESEDCACSLQFKVDETTGNLLVSIDGGATFVDSGICMNEEEDGETNVGACIFTGVAVDEENGTVTFTTPDGEFTVALAEVIEFNVKDTLYVAAGEKKSVTFEAGEAVSDVYVMNQPMGWRAAVEGNTLIVTAPAAEVVAMGIAEKAGVIALHLNTASGACKVAKLDVAFAELTLTIDDEGNFLIENTLVTTFMRQNPETWENYEVTDFLPWYFAVLPLDSYTGAPEDWYYGAFGTYNENMNYYGASYDAAVYEEGVVEKSICTGSLEDFINAITYGQVPFEGESFAVAVMPLNPNSYEPEVEKAVVVEFKQPKVAVSVAEATWQTVYLDVTLRGCQTYFVDFASKEEIGQYTDPAEFYAEEKLWMYDQYGQYGVLKLEEDYANSYIEFNEFMNYGASYFMDYGLAPGAEYELSILAIQEGKEEYTYEDLVIIPFALNDIVAAETPAEIIMEAEVDYTSIKPTVTVPETTVVMYYTWLDEAVEDEAAQAELITTLVNGYYKVNDFEENGYVVAHSNDRILSNWNITYNLTPGQTKVMAVVAIDAEGNYTLKQQAFTTKQVAVNETYTLGVGELSIEGGKLNVPVTGLDGAAISKYRYYLVDTSYYSLKDNETISAEMAISTHTHYKDITGDDITNPLVISQGLSGYSYKALVAGTTYKFALVALFADDTVSNVVIVDEVTYDMEFVKATDPAWEASKPTFTITSCIYEADYEMFDVYYKFELPEGVVAVYPKIQDPEYLQNVVGKSAKIRYMLDNCTTDWDEDGLLNDYVHDYYKLYFTWEDAEGKLYEVAEVDLTEYFDAAKNPGGGEELQPDLNTYGFTAVRANIMSGYAQIALDGGALQNIQIELNNAGYNPETFALVPGTYTLGDGYDDFVISKGSSATFVEGAEPTAMTLTIVDAGDGKYQFDLTATVFGTNIADRFTLPISAWS